MQGLAAVKNRHFSGLNPARLDRGRWQPDNPPILKRE
jgi:hypothetical protein